MIQILYVLVFVSLYLALYLGVVKASKSRGHKKTFRNSLVYSSGVALWVIYLYLISRNGFIFDKSMPPRFPIFVFAPILLFIIIFLYRKRNSPIFETIPKSWPIYFQSFRIVMELIILATFYAGIIPVQATFQGWNFEIVFALTAPVIGYFVFVRPIASKRIVIAWNILGILLLLVVVSIMVSAYFLPEVWGSTTELIDIRFTKLPLVLLPGFMVPSAIFVHLFSIMQLSKSNKKHKLRTGSPIQKNR